MRVSGRPARTQHAAEWSRSRALWRQGRVSQGMHKKAGEGRTGRSCLSAWAESCWVGMEFLASSPSAFKALLGDELARRGGRPFASPNDSADTLRLRSAAA